MKLHVAGRRVFSVVVLLLLGTAAATTQGTPDIRWMRGGHQSYINRILYSSDGTFFATGDSDWTIKIWRPSDGLLLRTIVVQSGVSTIALSPDNITVCGGALNASSLAVIRCYHVADGSPVWSADVPGVAANQLVDKLAFSPNGARIAAAVGTRLPIFDAATGSFITDFAGTYPNAFAGGLAYSPDGQLLGVNTAGDYPRLALLNASNGTLAWDTTAASISVAYDVAFSPDSQVVASVNGVGLRVFNTYLHTAHPFDTGWPATSVAFSPDGTRIATGYAYTGSLNLFNVSTGSVIRQWDAHGNSGYRPSVTFSADSSRLLSANFDIKRWKASDGSYDALLTGQIGPVWLLALSANDAVVATATGTRYALDVTNQHVISLFRQSDGALLRYIDYGGALSLRGIALSPDGHHVAAADDAGLRVWNVDTGALEATHAESGNNSYYRPLAYTPGGSAIAEGGDAMLNVSLWNPTTDTLTPIVGSPANVLRFLPDGRLVIAALVYRYASPSVVRIVTLAGHIDREIYGLLSIGSLAVSPDATMIAAGGIDPAFTPNYVTRIWRVSDGATLQTLVGHTNAIGGVGFSWDSKTVVTGAQDATARIWRVSDGTQVHLYDGETYMPPTPNLYGGIWSAVASSRSARFIYGRADATVVAVVNPEAQPKVLTFSVPTVTTGGCKAASSKVVLDRPAPPAGLTVSLASSSPDASVPATLAFKGGVSSKSFKINTSPVGALETATISATLDGQTDDRALGIRPIGIASLTLTPGTVTGGASVTGTVSLECNAEPGDIVVHLSSSIPSVALPEASVTILHGTTDKDFNITTVAVSATKKPTIKAATLPDAQSKSKKLTINP